MASDLPRHDQETADADPWRRVRWFVMFAVAAFAVTAAAMLVRAVGVTLADWAPGLGDLGTLIVVIACPPILLGISALEGGLAGLAGASLGFVAGVLLFTRVVDDYETAYGIAFWYGLVLAVGWVAAGTVWAIRAWRRIVSSIRTRSPTLPISKLRSSMMIRGKADGGEPGQPTWLRQNSWWIVLVAVTAVILAISPTTSVAVLLLLLAPVVLFIVHIVRMFR